MLQPPPLRDREMGRARTVALPHTKGQTGEPARLCRDHSLHIALRRARVIQIALAHVYCCGVFVRWKGIRSLISG
jgi:hypothetical protein